MGKRLFDFFMSLFLIIIFAPIIIIIALMIKLYMGSPVFLKQKRPGYKCRPFYFYKFRTMNEETDCQGNHLDDEQRLTVLGRCLRKYSLDELPQLFNVLKGELSFVGPRPLLMAYLKRYTSEQIRRHDVKPGVTGWAQVNGRNAITWEEKFALDLFYVDKKSFCLDLKILWMTVGKVLNAEGISQEGFSTMPEFMGYSTEMESNNTMNTDTENDLT